MGGSEVFARVKVFGVGAEKYFGKQTLQFIFMYSNSTAVVLNVGSSEAHYFR